MKRVNPFMALIALLNLAAAAWYASNGKPALAGITVCYAVSSAILAIA